MKKLLGLFICLYLTSCLFGANESSKRIMKDFYLASWDNRDWIVYAKDGNNIFEDENIILRHDVFALGNDEDFIFGKQHPCDNTEKHFMDIDSLKPNKAIINYFIIDTRHDSPELKILDNKTDYHKERKRLGISEDSEYKFIDNRIE